MPNRATLMTGRMPSLHGARQNGIPLALTATTFVEILRSAGYDTALIGNTALEPSHVTLAATLAARPVLENLFAGVQRGSTPVTNSRAPEEYLHANY